MAGTVTITEERGTSVKKIKVVWVSDASGNADGTTTYAYDGAALSLTTVPAAAGSAPTDNYDITALDEDGIDVLMGAGANRDTATTEQVLGTSLGAITQDVIAFHVTNAGNAKGGTIYLYIR